MTSPLDTTEVRAINLKRRLDDGEARIAAARDRGEDTSAWEEFWNKLAHEYVRLVEEAEAELGQSS